MANNAEKQAAKAGVKAAKAEVKALKKEIANKKKAAKKEVRDKKKAAKSAKNAVKIEQKAKKRIAKEERKAEKIAQQADQEPGKKKVGKKKILILIPVAAVAIGALAYFVIIPKLFPQEEPEPAEPEPIPAPLTYQLGETQIPALPVLGDSVLVYQEDPPVPETPEPEASPEALSANSGEKEADDKDGAEGEGEGEAEPEAEAEPPEITAVSYRYEGYTQQMPLLIAYTTLMTSEDVGFSFVDETLTRFKEEEYPSMDSPRGSILLARNAIAEADSGKALTIQLDWTPTNCLVTVDAAEGRVKDPPAPPQPAQVTPMTLVDAMDKMYTLNPADLGLEGTSMEDYTIYAMDGAVMIDGIPCLHLNVYDDSPVGTNEAAGQYFMSADGLHFYRLDSATNTVSELDTLP